jgi:type I restriction enzyme S subunit
MKNKIQSGWRTVKLGEVCVSKTGTRSPADEPNSIFNYVDITSVDNVCKRIVAPKELIGRDAPSRARQIIRTGDVLVSTTRPNLNAVALVPPELDNQIASTGFCVLRGGEEIDSEFLFSFVRTPEFVSSLTELTKGALYPAVNDKQVFSQFISLPPKDEQRRIAGRLREQMAAVERARAAVQAQLDAAQKLPATLLRDIFASAVARRWPRRRLGDVLETRNDIIHPHNKPTGTATFVGLEHIEPNTGRRIGSIEIDKAVMTGRKAQFFKGDIVYGYLRPYLNKVWIAEFAGLCSVDQYVYQVNRELAVTPFVAWFMRSSTYLERAPIGGSPGQLPRIRMEEVAATEINLPPPAEQQKIAARLDAELTAARSLVETLETRLAEIELLAAALLRSAFSQQN